MARHNETNTLELHIKVNGENLSAISEKCDIGTLRIPADPSWPKIPLRRSSNNNDDIIEPPCIITLTGTPRKGRSVVQAAASRHLKSRLSQRYEATTCIPKRLPGCFDPRFRRQISRQQAEKPDELCSRKNDEQAPELDTHITRETKELENKTRGTCENMDGYIAPSHDVDNLLSSVTKTADYPRDEQSILQLEAKCCPTSNSLQYATNERYDHVGNRFPQEQKQEINRPLLLMVDEKRTHALPINALNIEAASPAVQSLQCYSVQIPVVAYRDVPLQVSSIPTQIEKDVKVPSICQNNRVTDREIIENARTGSMYSFGETRNEKYPLDNVRHCNAKSSDNIYISGNKNISKLCNGHHTFGRIRDKENIDSNVPLNPDNVIMLDKDHYGNFDKADDVSKDKSRSTSNIVGRLKNFVGQNHVADSCITNRRNERKLSSSERKAAKIRTTQKLAHVKDRNSAGKPSSHVIIEKMQRLAFGEVGDKEYSKSNKEKENRKEKHAELRVKVKRKTANLSRKAKSFFRRRSRLAITDSDCTLILPGYRGIKGKRCKKACGRSKVSQSFHGKNRINSTNSILAKENSSKRNQVNSCSLTNLRAGNSIEKPSSIPLETRELLNKSYWEYYWKLREEIVSAKQKDDEKRRNECSNEDHLPESKTLQQCSVLSCMINTALRDSTQPTADGRPSSHTDSTVNVMSNARECIHEVSLRRSSPVFAKNIQRKRTKRTSKRLLGLRAVALLCIAMYVAVIFLPMIYDYFFEEYDVKHPSNYIELVFQYVASSLREALDGVVDVLTTILSVRFDRKR